MEGCFSHAFGPRAQDVKRTTPWILALVALVALLVANQKAIAALAEISSFDPAGVGSIVGLGYDQTTDTVWVRGNAAATLRQYSRTGSFLRAIDSPGEDNSDDFDIEFAREQFTFGAARDSLPEGTLLAINGQAGVAEIYAVDKTNGIVLATLTTKFGADGVVGGAYHPGRNTFFLVQSRQATGDAGDNFIAEIDPIDGEVVKINNIANSFRIDAIPGLELFEVNFGDLDINAAGNLLVVSSDESIIAEITPTGSLVQVIALPAGISLVSGLGVDDGRGQFWVSDALGDVHLLGEAPTGVIPEPASLVVWSLGALGIVTCGLRRRRAAKEAAAKPKSC